MVVALFLICLFASTLGAVAGFVGGVIIKPVLDAFGLLPVGTISFLSGCTVLSMSVVSLLRSRGGVKLELKTSTPLALGAALGGLVGKWLFDRVKGLVGSDGTVGAIQSAALLVVLVLTFVYILKKDSLRAYTIQSMPICLLIGVGLGMVSSFLGIGGGPYNVAVLFLLFSMDVKTAAKNSIYIILFSQLANLLLALVQGTVPPFEWLHLVFMALGGVGGAIAGGYLSKKLSADRVELILRGVVLLIIAITTYNLVRFLTA